MVTSDLLLTRRVFDSSPDFISVVDLDYRYQRVNPAYAKAFGINQDEIVGLLAQDLFGKDVFDKIQRPRLDRCVGGNEERYESWFMFPNLGKRYLSVSYFPLQTEASVIEGVIVVARDVTDRKQAQDEVLVSEARYRDLFESAPLAYLSAEPGGVLHMVNTSAVTLLGYSKEELIGKSVLDLYAPTVHGLEKKMRLKQQESKGVELVGEELQMARKDGTIIWVSVTVRLIYDQDGRVVERRGMVQNISERKNREKELADKQRRLQLMNGILSHINAGMTTEAIINQTLTDLSVIFPAYRISYSTITSNGDMEVLYAIEPNGMSALKGVKVALNGSPDYLAKLRIHQAVLISDITKNPIVEPVKDLMLSVQTRAICVIPLVHLGELQGLLCMDASEPHDWTEFERNTLAEVTELVALTIHNSQVEASRQETEKALLKSEDRFERYFESGLVGMAMTSVDQKWVEVNERLCEILGYSRQELTEMTWVKLTHSDDLVADEEKFLQLRSGKIVSYSIEKRFIQKNGEIVYTDMYVNAVRDDTGSVEYIMAMIEDITHRKKVEQTLEQQALVFETISDGVILTDLNGRIIDWNPGAEKAFGYEKSEVLGKSPAILHRPEESAVLTAEILAVLLRDKIWRGEINIIRKDGSHGVVETVVVPLYGADGSVIATIGANRDITNRKRAEEQLRMVQGALRDQNDELEQEVKRRSMRIQELEQRRMQVDKLAALAQVAAGVAHEINNPLASISQAMLLVKQAVDPTHPHFEYVGKIDECVNRMARIVRQLYDLYRPQQSIMVQQNIVSIVESAVDIMQVGAQKSQVHLQSSLPTHPILVECLSSELVQVLCNLIQNALDASTPGRQVEVTITAQEDAVSISIADQGSGISPDIAKYVFDPFFTTKGTEEGHGLGLGLSVSRSLIEMMGGMLNFTSNGSCGSLFTVRLSVR